MIESGYYHNLREPFTPSSVKLTLLFESPPVSGNYFYDPEGGSDETLFKAIMKLFGQSPETKVDGLQWLKDNGIVLLDATYHQVNKKTLSQRKNIMRQEYVELKSRLPDAPILIGMAAVFDAVEGLLVADGFKVLNQGVRIPFPAMSHQLRFYELAKPFIDRFF